MASKEQRAKDTATMAEYTRVTRGSIRKFDIEQVAGASPERICEVFEDYISDLLRVSPRPMKSKIAAAMVSVHAVPYADAQIFAQRTFL